MLPNNIKTALPVALVRDLLGITRALYRVEVERDCPRAERLEVLSSAGKELRAALRLAHGAEPGTMGMTASWLRAERAAEALGQLVTAPSTEPAVDLRAAVQLISSRLRTSRARCRLLH